ncbi:MAG: hypothetical protein H0V97_03000 [Actinobacteria bacterium]|nr:hypothetical protein [Actinomycetota bacterium]
MGAIEIALAIEMVTDGLSRRQWLCLVVPALADEGCAGASVVIYNPDLDPDHRVAADVVARLSEAFNRASRTTLQ